MKRFSAPMLVFVMPLKSRHVAKSWDYVTRLFERSLRSACNQTSPAFKVVVVCHERPAIEFSHPAVSYVEGDFPAPDPQRGSQLRDKYRKTVAGLIFARQFGPSHVMAVDADDCVSNRLAESVQRNSRGHGWLLESGYFHRDGTRRIYLKKKDFYRWCGTCNIVRHDLLRLPDGADCDDSILMSVEHSHMKERLARQGTPLEALPFPGAVYVETNYREGMSDRKSLRWKLENHPKAILHPAKKLFLHLFLAKPLTTSLREEFGLYPLSVKTNGEGA